MDWCKWRRPNYLGYPGADRWTNRNSDTFGHLPWTADYVRKLPSLGSKMKEMRTFCMSRTAERVKLGNNSTKDLFYYLVSSDFDHSAPDRCLTPL